MKKKIPAFLFLAALLIPGPNLTAADLQDHVRDRFGAIFGTSGEGSAAPVPEDTTQSTADTWRGNIRYFSQYDSRWQDEIMGDGKIREYGCLLSSLAMMLSADIPDANPKKLNAFFRENRGYVNGNMVVFGRIDSYPGSRFRYFSREDFNLAKLKSYVDRDFGVILGLPGNAHWVLVLGYREDGSRIEHYGYHDPGWDGPDRVFSASSNPVSMRVFSRIPQ